jgi:hypothetical protein
LAIEGSVVWKSRETQKPCLSGSSLLKQRLGKAKDQQTPSSKKVPASSNPKSAREGNRKTASAFRDSGPKGLEPANKTAGQFAESVHAEAEHRSTLKPRIKLQRHVYNEQPTVKTSFLTSSFSSGLQQRLYASVESLYCELSKLENCGFALGFDLFPPDISLNDESNADFFTGIRPKYNVS